MISTDVQNPIFGPKPKPILNEDSICGQYRIFLKQRFEAETESEPNAKPIQNHAKPLDLLLF